MWSDGYCGLDIVGTLFRVAKFEEMPEVAARPTPVHVLSPCAACGNVCATRRNKPTWGRIVQDKPFPLLPCVCVSSPASQRLHQLPSQWLPSPIWRLSPIWQPLKLEFIKEIGFTHMRVLDGLDTVLQMGGLVAKLCCLAHQARGGKPAPPRAA